MTRSTLMRTALLGAMLGFGCRGQRGRPPRCEPQQIVEDMARDRQYALAVSRALGQPIALTHPVGHDPTAVMVPAPAIPPPRAPADAGGTLTVSITQSGETYLEGAALADALLRERLVAMARANPEVRAVIAADRRVMHGRVVEVIDLVRGAGIHRFAIQTDVAQPAP